MNPAVLGIIRHIITLIACMLFAQTSMSPDDINSVAAGAMALIGFGWSIYEKRADGFDLKRKRYQPGDEIREGGQT